MQSPHTPREHPAAPRITPRLALSLGCLATLVPFAVHALGWSEARVDSDLPITLVLFVLTGVLLAAGRRAAAWARLPALLAAVVALVNAPRLFEALGRGDSSAVARGIARNFLGSLCASPSCSSRRSPWCFAGRGGAEGVGSAA